MSQVAFAAKRNVRADVDVLARDRELTLKAGRRYHNEVQGYIGNLAPELSLKPPHEFPLSVALQALEFLLASF